MPDGRLFRLVGIHLKSRLSRDGSAEDTRRREAYALRDYLNEALASQDGMPLLLYGDLMTARQTAPCRSSRDLPKRNTA